MTKSEILTKVSVDTGCSKALVSYITESLLENISSSLASGESVVFSGFGTFETVVKKAKVGRNIHKGEEIKIPAHIAPRFKPGKPLKDLVYKEI